MTIVLTPEQRQQLSVNGSDLVRAVNPDTEREYILVETALYAKLRPLLEPDDLPSPSIMNEIMAEDDAGDPWLDYYQQFRKDHS